MTVKEYIVQLKGTIKKLEVENEFEVCQMANELLECLITKNTDKYIKSQFDIKALNKAGFLKKGMTTQEIAERVCTFFSFDNVFQYSVNEGMFCPYERYTKGMHEIITKCIW